MNELKTITLSEHDREALLALMRMLNDDEGIAHAICDSGRASTAFIGITVIRRICDE